MKIATVISVMIAASIALAEDRVGVVTVSNVSAVQDARTDVLSVTYDLENTQNNEPAYVFMDVLTNGVSIGIGNIRTVEGDISASNGTPVAPGTGKSFTWKAGRDWRDQYSTNATIMVYAYYTNKIDLIPGVYMKVDLASGGTYPVIYSMAGPKVDAAGHAVDAEDKTRWLWLRRLEACPGGYTMGASINETSMNYWYYGERETPHTVILTKPFFAGVFPVTRGQWRRIMGSDPVTVDSSDSAPVSRVTYNDVRGTTAAGGVTVDWPNNSGDMHVVGTGSFLETLRSRTGVEFDLPTEAQWEYACRAGTTGAWNNGTTMVPDVTNVEDPNLDLLGWYLSNTPSAMPQPVGQKDPNAWGLYDFHGNVWEWCLDHIQTAGSSATVTDPVGPTSGGRTMKGGGWNSQSKHCRSARRDSQAATEKNNEFGFRLVAPAE